MANELTAILFALHREATPFRRLAGFRDRVDAPLPTWRNESGMLVVVTGMGAERSQAALDWLLRTHRPARVISAGFCGSLIEAYRVGMLVQPAAIFQEGESLLGWSGAGLISVQTAVLGTEARRRLHVASRAAIVDMESATIMHGCAREGIAFQCLRVVSDDLATPLPVELSVILEGERLLFGRLLPALARRPALLLDLLRLARHSREAAHRLATGLLELLRTSPGCSGVR